MNFLEYFEAFERWFQSLPRRMQWVVGIPLVGVACASVVTLFYPNEGPAQAIWVNLLLLVAAVVLNELLRPKPNIEDARPAGLGDFSFPTATEGRVIPIIWGRVRIDGPNVVWYGDLRQEAITEKLKTGLWSSTRVTTGFRYHIGIQFALCRGPATLRRIWIGKNEVYSGTASSDGDRIDIDEADLLGGEELGNGGVQSSVDFYTGSSTQTVNAYLDDPARQQVAAATATAPRYLGTCYLVARQLTGAAPTSADEGAYIGNSTTIKRWSFEVQRYPDLFSGQSSGHNQIGADANPVNVVYELLTNSEWGFGLPAADIDVGASSTFKDASDTLRTEANGFSFVMDRPRKANDLLQEIQRQIDGVVYLDQRSGLWKIKLARADYTIGNVPQLNDDNVLSVQQYSRGSWEDTTNQITVKFTKRDDDYKQSFAVAQDMANSLIQGDGTVTGGVVTTGEASYPGVMDAATAANLAWRDLRGQSYPLARATLVVDRTFYGLSIGDVVAWTSTALGFTQLPMRINRIGYGNLRSNQITLDLVQDVFEFAAASYGDPAASGWSPPSLTLSAYPSDELLAFEAPRGIVSRDPTQTGFDETTSRVFTAARNQVGEVAYQIGQRNDPVTPGGSYADAGTITKFMRIGSLKAALPAGSTFPLATITITASPDSQTNLEQAFDDSATLTDLGVDLVHLIYVGGEFMLVSSAANGSGTDVDLQNVYRGVLDSGQQSHVLGEDVYLVHLGAGLADTVFDNTHKVDVQLYPRTSTSTLTAGAVTTSLTMSKRMLRPAPPAGIRYNSTPVLFAVPDLEDNGSGENGQQFPVSWRRRRYDVTDDVAALLADTDPDGASGVSSTEYQVSVFVDPSGSDTEITSSPFAWTAGTGTIQVPRLELIEIAAAGTEIRVEVSARHTIGSETLESLQAMTHDVTPTSVLDGLFYLGGNLGPSTGSNSYTAASSGTFTVRIGAAYSTSNVQYRLNGGSWTTAISAGGTSGTIAGVSSSDTIELRHTASESPDPQFVEIEDPSTTRVAYGTFSA